MLAVCRSRIIIVDGHLKFYKWLVSLKVKKTLVPYITVLKWMNPRKLVTCWPTFYFIKLILRKEGWSTEKKNSSQTSSLKYMTSVTLAGLQLSPDSLYCDKICAVTLDSIMRTWFERGALNWWKYIVAVVSDVYIPRI